MTRAAPTTTRDAVVLDFLAALTDPFTYQPWRNHYALFGLLWAIPIPLFALALLSSSGGVSTGAEGLGAAFLRSRVALLSLVHMPLFMVVFGAFGSLRRLQDQRITSLVATLEERLRELRDSHQELAQLDRLKDEFVANVTHELKTPLVSACAYSEMMLKGRMGEISDRQKHGLEVAVRNLRRLEVLIDDMLLLAQMEAGSVAPLIVPFPIAELVLEMGTTFQAPCAAKGVTLELPDPVPAGLVAAEQEGVRTVLVNLLSNALKFSQPGGAIRLAAEEVPGGVRIEVDDDGHGIPPEALPRIFDRFHQAEGARRRRFGGAGLGLAIVKRVLDAHGIEISVESVEGDGTCFRFVLPRVAGGGDRHGE